MRFSIVIPTYNRSEKLAACLKTLFEQDFPKSEYEIVVVDDGSNDDTQKILVRAAKKSPIPLIFLHQNNQGQGVARNRGVEAANGDIILLLGDDIIATPGLLKEHNRLHHWYPEQHAAVLGFITWHPKLEVTPLMRFMEQGGAILGRFGGHQFAFDLLAGKKTADYRFFYTSNISLKRSLLLKYKFDPWFAGYGWEDIELGFRLQRDAGLVLYYAPEAVTFHDHMMNEEQFANRMRNIGASSTRLSARHPELAAIPSRRKQRIFQFLSHPLTLSCLRPLSKNLYFYALSKKYFLQGLKGGYNIK